MPEIDLDRPLFTKRGGVVTGFREPTKTELDDVNSRVFSSDKYCGIETFKGATELLGWTEDFRYFRDGNSGRDLTNTPTANVAPEPSPVEPASDELSELRNRVEELESLLRQSRSENSSAWKVAVKYQRMAAKGATR